MKLSDSIFQYLSNNLVKQARKLEMKLYHDIFILRARSIRGIPYILLPSLSKNSMFVIFECPDTHT